jgi:hypothetical protein
MEKMMPNRETYKNKGKKHIFTGQNQQGKGKPKAAWHAGFTPSR